MNPLQPAFKVRVYKIGARPSGGDTIGMVGTDYAGKGDASFMDIEACVGWGVSLSKQISSVSMLTFTIVKHAETLLQRMRLGQAVVFYGGYEADGYKGLKKIFVGSIIRIRTQFDNNGRATAYIECMNRGFKEGRNEQHVLYPDKNSYRKFLSGKTEISLKEIIEGITEECDLNIGAINLPPEAASKVYTEKEPESQRGLSDWEFLQHLAKKYGCSCWVDLESGVPTLFFEFSDFIDDRKAEEIEFVYPLQGDVSITDIQPGEWHKFPMNPNWDRPRILRDITVDEDLAGIHSISRSAVYYDKSTGQNVEAISQVMTTEDGKYKTVFYSLDESRVEEVHRTQPELADKIRSMDEALPWAWDDNDPSTDTPNCLRYYYKAHVIEDEDNAVFDRMFIGLTVEATCQQDLDIEVNRVYKIRGIIRYSSDNLVGNYRLMALTHRWEADGSWTDLEFLK